MIEKLEDWAERLSRQLREFGAAARELVLDPEAERLLRVTQRTAPSRTRRLRRSLATRATAEGAQIVTSSPYARQVDEGGPIRARRHGWLVVPVSRYSVGAPGYVTVGSGSARYVLRAGTGMLAALRLREVRTRPTRFLARALRAHMEGAADRVADVLEREIR